MKNFAMLFCTFFFSISFNDLAVLSIEIKELKNSSGAVFLELLDQNKKVISGISKDIKNRECKFRIPNLEQGKYSFRYFHDENKNQKLDFHWAGFPKEGFGFSNNAKAIVGKPAFDKTLFSVPEKQTMECKPQYILK